MQEPRLKVRKSVHGLYSVIDIVTGLPPEIGVTAILLTQSEAERLVVWLQSKTRDPDCEDVQMVNAKVNERYRAQNPRSRR